MNKNPFFNAVFAAVYIVVIVIIINAITSISTLQETILIPMVMLSLFVLSAAVMGFLFVYEPLRLHLDNQRREAIIFFAKTVGYFAFFAAFFLSALLYTSILL